jgi:hypothetical protein
MILTASLPRPRTRLHPFCHCRVSISVVSVPSIHSSHQGGLDGTAGSRSVRLGLGEGLCTQRHWIRNRTKKDNIGMEGTARNTEREPGNKADQCGDRDETTNKRHPRDKQHKGVPFTGPVCVVTAGRRRGWRRCSTENKERRSSKSSLACGRIVRRSKGPEGETRRTDRQAQQRERD